MNDLEALSAMEADELSSDTLAPVQSSLSELERNVTRLRSATELPLGSDLMTHVPWIGPRYEAAHQVLDMAELLTAGGVTATEVGREAIDAFEEHGAFASENPSDRTWLTVLEKRETELHMASAQIAEAQEIRAELDASLLPGNAEAHVQRFDRLVERLNPSALVDHDLPALIAAFAPMTEDEETARFLVLFQNPAELRPAGGFQGSVALVTTRRGQITDVEFSSVAPLSHNYLANRSEILPLPYAIDENFPQDGFQIQDAIWWADFPRSGSDFMTMYEETSWPEIKGVVAVQPSVISDLLEVFGGMVIDVDGEDRTITHENVYDEIERQQRRIYALENHIIHHKELVAIIGEELLNEIRAADTEEIMLAARAMRDAADRRDIQVYSLESEVQEMLDRHHWSGRLIPDEDVPTLAVNFANVVIAKSSLRMQPTIGLWLGEENDGMRVGRLQIEVEHTGTEFDPMYSGFQRWWIEVTLPEGSRVVHAEPGDENDPEAPTGGSYVLQTYPGDVHRVELEIELPESDEILIRRQPGVPTAYIVLEDTLCGGRKTSWLERDWVVDMQELCDVRDESGR